MGYGYFVSKALKCNFVGYEYSGYGLSRGCEDGKKRRKASERDTYADILAAYRWLTEEKGIEGRRIIVVGRSVGSGPSVWLVSRKDIEVGGLIVVCGFTSILRVVYNGWVPGCLDMFENVKRIRKVRCPVLTVHGTEDEVIPFEHGKRLYARVGEGWACDPLWIEGKGHNNAELDNWKATFKVYRKFLETVEDRQKQVDEGIERRKEWGG